MTEACPGCSAALPPEDGPTHPYIGASAACWARFGEVSAREYENLAAFGVHQLTVDVYAVQHPGVPERRSIQSVALHLMTLSMVIEDGMDPGHGVSMHKRMVERGGFAWLDPPAMEGRMTVLDVLATAGPVDHERAVRVWAGDVWEAWSAHHETVRGWVRQSLAPAGSAGVCR